MDCPYCGSDKTFYSSGDYVLNRWIEQWCCVECESDFEVVN